MSRSSLGRTLLAVMSLLGLMSIFSAPAIASGPPIVTAGEATEKTLHNTTVTGTVNPNSLSTTYKIEYGKTKLYGSSTKSVSVGSGSSAVPVSQLLYGLEPLTTYHYRVSATNSSGTTVSEDRIFEMLLAWKVEGKNLSEYPEGVGLGNNVPGPTVLTAEGKIGITTTKVSCESEEAYSGSFLGSKYNFSFPKCKTFLNGVENKACAPATPLVVNLNSVMVPAAGTAIKMSEECAVGEQIALTGSGFSLGALAEAKTQAVTLSEQLPIFGMKTTISNPAWILIGAQIGKKFGIS